MPSPVPTAAERFAIILRCLTQAAVDRGGGGRLSQVVIVLIIDRIRGITQRVARIFARLRAGTYAPRRFVPRAPGVRRQGPPTALPRTPGWLLHLVPDAIGLSSQLEHLLRDPEMAALLAAAPGSLRRPLRSLCRMLRVEPPAILATPRPTPPPPPPSSAPSSAPPPTGASPGPRPLGPPAPPGRTVSPPVSAPAAAPPPRACGPPHPA